ncbi:MAG: hypothetical protein ACLPVW_09080, partial [Terriglobales bacterium]
MQKLQWCCALILCSICASAQQSFTWEQVRLRFEQNNPTLLAGKLSVDESKAQEITPFCAPTRVCHWRSIRSIRSTEGRR